MNVKKFKKNLYNHKDIPFFIENKNITFSFDSDEDEYNPIIMSIDINNMDLIVLRRLTLYYKQYDCEGQYFNIKYFKTEEELIDKIYSIISYRLELYEYNSLSQEEIEERNKRVKYI